MIKIKPISKKSDNLIKKVESELMGAKEIYVDKKINYNIEREISHLAKEKLIVDHIQNLSKKINKKNKNKILFLLVKLYNFNNQIHQSLSKELKNNKKILNKRISLKIKKNKVHKDLYKKLLKIANKHYNVVKRYADSFNPKKKHSKSFILNIVYHKRKAETIYNALTNIKMRNTLHKILLKKLDKVYQSLVEFTVQLAKMIVIIIKNIRANKFRSIDKTSKHIQSIVSDKINILKSFAYKYTYNIIHSDHFFDFDGKKLVLITKKDHSKI